jgi:hypothetical protein
VRRAAAKMPGESGDSNISTITSFGYYKITPIINVLSICNRSSFSLFLAVTGFQRESSILASQLSDGSGHGDFKI